jgi:toxin ParE1/3/4
VKLRYTPRAAVELDKVLSDIELESRQGALRVKARVQSIINLILQYPHAAPLRSKRGIRRMVVYPYPYLIFYKATAAEVVIHGVRHAARRPSSMPS